MDTIFALASAWGKSGVAVIRISGDRAFDAVEALSGKLPLMRQASLRRLVHAGAFLDEALVLLFEKGASFTGEKSAELQIHGSIATLKAVLGALGVLPGLRLAEPGEFTRRAMENGRLDLTQVEGLIDLIDAETEAQRRQALAVMSGELGRKADEWRKEAIRAAALIEAGIDFSDEDIPDDVADEVVILLSKLKRSISAEIDGAKAAESIRAGFEVAIVGAPNVGKSTLLNALAGREAAITSELAGTTRDVIEVRMEIAGLAVTLLDTAGLRETEDQIEKIGVARAMSRAKQADLRIFLLDGKEDLPIAPFEDDIVVVGKADLGLRSGATLSGLTGQGVDDLVNQIGERLLFRVNSPSLLTNERHRQAMSRALDALDAAERVLQSGGMVEVAASEMRRGAMALEMLIGRVGVEDVLGEIFTRFCIGK